MHYTQKHLAKSAALQTPSSNSGFGKIYKYTRTGSLLPVHTAQYEFLKSQSHH